MKSILQMARARIPHSLCSIYLGSSCAQNGNTFCLNMFPGCLSSIRSGNLGFFIGQVSIPPFQPTNRGLRGFEMLVLLSAAPKVVPWGGMGVCPYLGIKQNILAGVLRLVGFCGGQSAVEDFRTYQGMRAPLLSGKLKPGRQGDSCQD